MKIPNRNRLRPGWLGRLEQPALWAGVALLLITLASEGHAQRKMRYGRVCGDPTAKCADRESFGPHDMPFVIGHNSVIAESEQFYLVILKSLDYQFGSECEKAFPESERLDTQGLFPRNKVVVQRCSEPGEAYYSGLGGNTAFLGVYAGKTASAAKAFLKKIKASGNFPGAYLRRTRTGVNGT